MQPRAPRRGSACPVFLPDTDSCRSCERTGMSGVAQRSRSDTRQGALDLSARERIIGRRGQEGPRRDPGLGAVRPRLPGCPHEPRGRIRPYRMNTAQLPVTDPLPEAVSVKIFSHPQAVRSSTWLSSFWPRVDTRAYPILASISPERGPRHPQLPVPDQAPACPVGLAAYQLASGTQSRARKSYGVCGRSAVRPRIGRQVDCATLTPEGGAPPSWVSAGTAAAATC